MKNRTVVRIAPTLLALMLPFSVHAANPIKIGSVLSVTGPAAFLGEPELKTLELYVEQLNREGGLLGRKVELVYYDDAGDSAKAYILVRRLIQNDKVDLIVGGTTSGVTMAVATLAQSSQTPFISLAGSVTIVEPLMKWVFKVPQTERLAVEKVFEDMKKRGISNIALLSESSSFGLSAHKEAIIVARRKDIKIVADETYGPKDTDVTAQLTKIKNAPGIQAVFVLGFGQGPTIVTKNYAQLGMTNLPHYQTHGVASGEYIRLSGQAAEGVRLPASALLVAVKLPPIDPQKRVLMGYTRDYQERYKTDASTFGGYAYDGLMIATNAIKRAGSTEKPKVRDAIESTTGFIGTTGVFNMTPSDHMGLDLTAFRMLEIKGGDWSIVK